MRVGVAIAAVGALIVSTYFTVALISRNPFESAPVRPVQDEAPPVAASGPYPRAAIDPMEFDFGRMESGEERQHEFTIRNEGEAPLIVKRGLTTCQCTVAELETGELAVGASAKITVKWKPPGELQEFNKRASILTNDPENRVIQLKIVGKVVPRLVAFPGRHWEVPDSAFDKPAVITGLVISPVVDEFHILALTCASPYVTAECLPIEPEQLQDRDGRSGYQVRVAVSPEVPLGAFRFPLAIKTDVPERNLDGTLGKPIELEVLVSGERRGPLRIVGREWDENQMAIAMGAFKAAEGRKLSLMVFVRDAPAEGLRLTEAPVCQPAALKASLAPDPKAPEKQSRYLLTLEYPPGAPRALFLKGQSASVRLRTNHPEAPEMNLQVYLNAN
jgi:hypothetical protein